MIRKKRTWDVTIGRMTFHNVVAKTAGAAVRNAVRHAIKGKFLKRQPRTNLDGWFEDTRAVVVS